LARPASSANGARGANPALRLAAIRQVHTYLGVFIAPSILFFAVTGAWQLFSLHEAHGGYRPPPLIEKLSAVHKDQRFGAKSEPTRSEHGSPASDTKPQTHDHADADDDHDHDATPSVRALTLKWLFLAIAVSLMVSTILGLWMAIAHGRRKGVILGLLALGAALPVLILLA
jgi:hypothetical protein